MKTETGERISSGGGLSIAMVAPCPFPTAQGTQVFIGALARALHRRGHRIHLVTYHYGHQDGGGESNAGEGFNGVGLHRSRPLPVRRKLTSGPSVEKPLIDLLLAVKLDQVVRDRRIDLIHAHNYEGLLAGLLIGRLRHLPVIFHTHNTMMDELPGYSRTSIGRRISRWLGDFLDGQFPRRAQACIAVTPETARYIRERGMAADRTRAIPPAVDGERFRAAAGSRSPAVPPVVLYAGNLDSYQNLEMVISSFRKIRDRRPDVRLRIVTHAPAAEVTRAAHRWRKRRGIEVIRADSFNDLRAHLQECRVALCPRTSPYGFPIKLLNYLAAGKPVVVCRGSAQGIEHLENGWVVEDGDRDGFAEAVLRLLEDEPLRRRLSENARRTVRETFSWESLIPRYEEVYQEVLNRWNG
jgi:glycosyltransferase involved in cell wall biosynthesis